MEKLKYACKDCEWVGFEQSLDYEVIDGCFGEDKLEICPKCGSQNVFIIKR
jgi:Zn finger protein HypA/HybF involved in hydrogenase expression